MGSMNKLMGEVNFLVAGKRDVLRYKWGHSQNKIYKKLFGKDRKLKYEKLM